LNKKRGTDAILRIAGQGFIKLDITYKYHIYSLNIYIKIQKGILPSYAGKGAD